MKKLITIISIAMLSACTFDYDESYSKSYPLSSVLKVSIDEMDVSITQSSSNNFEVKVESDKDFEDNYNLNSQIVDDTLSLDFEKTSKRTVRGIIKIAVPNTVNNITLYEKSGDVTFNYNTQGNYKITSRSGDVDVIDANGNYIISASSGDVRVKNGSNYVSGDMEIKANSDVDVNYANGNLKVKTGSGDVTVKKIQGSFDLYSGFGDINVDDAQVVASSKIKARSGDVDVDLDDVQKYNIHTTAISGDIKIGDIFTSQKSASGGDANSMIRIDIESGSGDITIH